MNKTIYEVAIELMKLNILPRQHSKTSKTKVIQALQQAQKQEKLLNLYREKEKHEQEFPALNNMEHEDYQRIKTKIRELENNG